MSCKAIPPDAALLKLHVGNCFHKSFHGNNAPSAYLEARVLVAVTHTYIIANNRKSLIIILYDSYKAIYEISFETCRHMQKLFL